MDMKEYSNLKEAIESIIPDKEYLLVKHNLDVGEEIKPHYHEKANEWIIADNGVFMIGNGDEQQRFEVGDRVLVICLPKGKRHSFAALTRVSYFVLRDEINEQIHYSVNGY